MKLKLLGQDYIPGTESFAEGFRGPKGNVGFTMAFSMRKARLIAKQVGEGTTIREITAGLDGDFGENSEVIYDENGWHKPSYMYEHSIWATPIVIIKYTDRPSEAYECWSKMK